MEHGQVQIYCGDGKGKTTAAVGLAVRALGAGLRVYLGQFIKDMDYHELAILRRLPGITVELYGSGSFDVVILDEINVACRLGLLTEAELLALLDCRPETVELVYTGRGCPQGVLDRADLVTEMREVRHYYRTKGLLARDGIER